MSFFIYLCSIVILPISGTINLAYMRPAIQSSNATDTYTADKAVDGIKKRGTDKSSFCAFTSSERTTWWQVDLGRVYEVKTISIITRTQEHLANLTITISKHIKGPEVKWTSCVQKQEVKSSPTILHCIKSVTGRHLRISQTRLRPSPLVLCEVEVQGSVPKQLYTEHTYRQLSKRIKTATETSRRISISACALDCSLRLGCDSFQWKHRPENGDNNCMIGGVAHIVPGADDWLYFEISSP